jgi:SAM-dependent methyltransferase
MTVDHASNIALPSEFDADSYRLRYPELESLSSDELTYHYQTVGVDSGRAGSTIASRADFVRLMDGIASILEIGPLANPSVRGENVKYFDVLSTEALREKARKHGLDVNQCPNIDFVSPNGDLAAVTQLFDAVVSSHAVEHQTDLIYHLEGVARILKPDGRYFLAVPDKRYCFDYFIAESSIADVVDAHVRELRFHSMASVIEHVALTTHNDPARHWVGDHGQSNYLATPERIRDAANMYMHSAGKYVDTHAWQFVPTSFKQILQALYALRLSAFEVERVYPTVRNSNEFYVVLKKAKQNTLPLREELPADFDEREYLLANSDVERAGVDAKEHYLTYGRREGRKLRR